MKCEAYSTLSDFDGDGEVEAKLQQRITTAGGPAAPRLQAIAPAALYLTAILEYVPHRSTLYERYAAGPSRTASTAPSTLHSR